MSNMAASMKGKTKKTCEATYNGRCRALSDLDFRQIVQKVKRQKKSEREALPTLRKSRKRG